MAVATRHETEENKWAGLFFVYTFIFRIKLVEIVFVSSKNVFFSRKS